MNPNGLFWYDLFMRLGVESSVLMGLAALGTRKTSPQQQRKVWQVALTMLMLLFVIEGTGLHQRMHFRAAQPKAESTARRLTIQVMPAQALRPIATQPGIAKSFSGTWLPGIVWLAVFGAVVGRSFGSRLLFMACKTTRRAVIDPTLQQTVEALAARMNLRGRIHLSESHLLAGPVAFGFVRRCICLPADFARNGDREQQVMLAHELAHLAVRDPFWYAVLDFAAALFWFNPFVWLGRRGFQRACETAADEASVLVQDGAPTLAECLVQLGKRLAGVKSYGWIGIEGRRSALSQRVQHLLKLDGKPVSALTRWRTATICFVGGISLIAVLASSAAVARDGLSLAERLWHLHLAQLPAPALSVNDNPNLRTRTFRVQPATFEQSVKDFVAKQGRAPADEFGDDLRFFFEAFGVDLSPPTQLFYNPRTGILMVRSALKDLDALEQVLTALNASPPQLVIEAKFAEFSNPLDALEVRNFAIGGDQNGTNAFRGILTPSRYREVLKRLEARAGVDILSAPKLTTLSGRPAQIKIVDVKYIVTDLDNSGGQTNAPKPIIEPFELGPALDVIPLMREDGVSIEMTLISTIREFIGYDLSPRYFDSGPPRPITPGPIREYLRDRDSAANSTPDTDPRIPLPTFRIRQAQPTRSCIWDGQTVVLALEGQTQFSKNPNLRYASSGKPVFLFVTATLIDPAGNRVNNESALPFVENGVPK